MKEGEKVKVLDLPNDQERKDGIYEEFWKVRDPYVFAKKILNQSSARKYFRSEGLYKNLYCKTNESVKVDFRSKDKIRKIIKKEASKMTIFEVFAQKDMRRLKQKIMCKFIRAIILHRKESLSVEESIQVWMQCSGSLDQMRQHQQYYKNILQQMYFDVSEHQIDQDIKRSRALVSDESHLQIMKRIFIAYARRNAYIGYCQGLNYIVAKFLRYKLSEEESFWLLVQLLENILPLDYYPSMMMGVVCDQKIFEQLLRIENEKVYKKLISFEANVLNILLTQWIVCLFTQTIDDSLLLIFFNHLFTKGSITIFKVCLVLIDHCKNEILKAEGLEIVKVIEEKLRNWKDTKKFKQKLEKIYINEKGINFMREFYKQICLIQLIQKSQIRRGNQNRNQIDYSKIVCNQEYPTCKYILEQENSKDNNHPPEYFIFKSQRTITIDWNYFKKSKVGDKRNVSIDEDETIMQTMHDHICPKKELSIKIESQNILSILQQEEEQKQSENKPEKIDQLQQELQNPESETNVQIKEENEDDEEEEKKEQDCEPTDQQITDQKIDNLESLKTEQEQHANRLRMMPLQEQQEEQKQQLFDFDKIEEFDSPRSQKLQVKEADSCILQEVSANSETFNRYQEEWRYSSDSNVEPSLFFKKEELDNSNSFRFFSDITKQRNKFNYLINPNRTNGNQHGQSEITKVINEVQEEM